MTTTPEQRYEYKFVRLGEGWLGARHRVYTEYQEVVREHARDGWRLVQALSPGVGGHGFAKFLELVFERPSRKSL